MEIIIYFLLIQICYVVTLFQTKWCWKFALMSNTVFYNIVLFDILTYNKLFIGYQNIFKLEINLQNNIFIIFWGYYGISLLFLWLTALIISICILLSKNRIYKNNEYVLWILLVQFCLVMVFTSLDLIIFFLFFEFILIPVYLIINKWCPTVRRFLAGYYFFMYTLFGSVFMLLGISFIIW